MTKYYIIKGEIDMPERLQRVRLREIDNELSYEELRELGIIGFSFHGLPINHIF